MNYPESSPSKPRFIITGMAGSGKTTVGAMLKDRGQHAYDGDYTFCLSGWYDGDGNELDVRPTNLSAQDHGAVSFMWDPKILENCIYEAENNPSIPRFVLTGIASNVLDIAKRFGFHVIYLYAKPEMLRERQWNRNDAVFEITYDRPEDLSLHNRLSELVLRDMVEFGATVIDTTEAAPSETATTIMTIIERHQPMV
ncbi:MAG: hypothetical protein ACREGD_04780 [Candidatus Saccharimonadales bacterium]